MLLLDIEEDIHKDLLDGDVKLIKINKRKELIPFPEE
jgi:hypothetical protein